VFEIFRLPRENRDNLVLAVQLAGNLQRDLSARATATEVNDYDAHS
jgi:hypothetical protein